MMPEMQKLYDLNEDFYKSFARLKKNAEFLTDKQYKAMADALTSNYQKELHLLSLERNVAYKRDIFKLKRRIQREVPFSFLFFKNREGKLILKEIEEDYDLLTTNKERRFEKKKGKEDEGTSKV